jgi:hypothetical protein
VTNATLWAVMATTLLAARMPMAVAAGWFLTRNWDVVRLWWLIPARDLCGFAVWMAGLFGNSVTWQGKHLRLDRQGRIQSS